MPVNQLLLFAALIVAVFITIITKKLTIAGGITGGLLAILIYAGLQMPGIVFMGAFFLLGTWATAHQMEYKRKIGVAEQEKGKRTAAQVFANAGVAALAGIIAILFPHTAKTMILVAASSFSAAAADTLSSELGNVYGKRFYNIISLKKDLRGLDGVVSAEGTLAGMAGSIVISACYLFFTSDIKEGVIIFIAGTIGNLTDSVLGATVERKGWVKNDAVNLLNTLVAAMASLVLLFLVLI